MLILAGVSIATLTGDNGILTRARKAQDEQADATVKEAISLAWNEYQIEINNATGEIVENETKIASTTQVRIQGKKQEYLATSSMSFLDFLEGKGYIDKNGIVNVKALTGETLSKGNGKDGGTDVYKIEEDSDMYILNYYDENGKEKELLQIMKINANLKTLTIEDRYGYWGENITIQYEEGMTWEEWINSKYNSQGFRLSEWDDVWIGEMPYFEMFGDDVDGLISGDFHIDPEDGYYITLGPI